MAIDSDSKKLRGLLLSEEEIVAILERYIDAAIEEYNCLNGSISEDDEIHIGVVRFPGKRVIEKLQELFREAGWELAYQEGLRYLFVVSLSKDSKKDKSGSWG